VVGAVERVVVGVSEPDGIQLDLRRALEPLAARGAAVSVAGAERGGVHFVDCRAEPAPAAPASDFREAVASALAAWVVTAHEGRRLRRLVASRYGYLEPPWQTAILERAERALGAGDGDRAAARFDRVRAALRSYLDGHELVLVEGFVTFRLKGYLEELALAVDRAADELAAERELRAFLSLLRRLVGARSARPGACECVVGPDGAFSLEDADGRVMALGAPGGGPDWEDRLLSALVAAAPRHLRLHLRRGAAVSPYALEAMRAVFLGAVELCPGCGRCGGEEGEGAGPPPPDRR
jgi:putative sporulation protein YtxC